MSQRVKRRERLRNQAAKSPPETAAEWLERRAPMIALEREIWTLAAAKLRELPPLTAKEHAWYDQFLTRFGDK